MARKKKGGGSRGGSPWYLAMFTGLFALIAGAVMLLVRLLLKILPEREWWAALFASRRFRLHASVVLSFVLFMAGLRLMRGHLEAQERYVIDPSRITLSTGAITWAEGESRTLLESMISNDLYQRLSNLPQSHAFDDEILASVAQKLKASPWVSSVERIERHFPAEQVSSCLAVSLKIRKPVVMVEVGDAIYLVDSDCVVLPYVTAINTAEPTSLDARIAAGLSPAIRRVIHADSRQPPVPGAQWLNEQIRAAVSVEAALRQHKADNIMPIEAIDVADVGTKRSYTGTVPYTPGRGVGLVPPRELSEAMIFWGKAPVHANGMEPSIEDKMTRLRVISDADPGLQQNPIYWLNTQTP